MRPVPKKVNSNSHCSWENERTFLFRFFSFSIFYRLLHCFFFLISKVKNFDKFESQLLCFFPSQNTPSHSQQREPFNQDSVTDLFFNAPANSRSADKSLGWHGWLTEEPTKKTNRRMITMTTIKQRQESSLASSNHK